MGLLAPTLLSAISENEAVSITWAPIMADGLIGYNVFLNGVLHNQALVTDKHYRMTGLQNNTAYGVNVAAVYQSSIGEGLIVTPNMPPAENPLPPISGLSVIEGPSKVTLNWDPITGVNLAGYNIFMNDVRVNAELRTTNTFDIVNLTYGTRYDFQVEAMDQNSVSSGRSEKVSGSPSHYLVELERWGIRNDGTDASGTTAGINLMLLWASAQQIHAVYLPSGSYMVSKDSQINMVANMLWELPDDAIIQKETNGKENYKTLAIMYGTNNVTLRGGWYKGDRETHNYSGKDTPYSAGTHESGYGILLEGANEVVIEGVKATHFTGDGLVIGGAAQLGSDIYAGNFESGSLNDAGVPVNDQNQIRTIDMFSLTKSRFVEQKFFEFSNWSNAFDFQVYFYNDKKSFITRVSTQVRTRVDIPEGATQMRIVINKPSATGIYGEYWQRVASEDTIIRNSEFAFNRRQGITVGGGHNTLIENNKFHDMSGVAPMSGIDVEGGYGENGYWNSNITIRKNEFWNNARYDVILYDGRGAVVADNHLASKGAIGVAVSSSFAGDAVIQNNHFDGTRIIAYHDATFLNNK